MVTVVHILEPERADLQTWRRGKDSPDLSSTRLLLSRHGQPLDGLAVIKLAIERDAGSAPNSDSNPLPLRHVTYGNVPPPHACVVRR